MKRQILNCPNCGEQLQINETQGYVQCNDCGKSFFEEDGELLFDHTREQDEQDISEDLQEDQIGQEAEQVAPEIQEEYDSAEQSQKNVKEFSFVILGFIGICVAFSFVVGIRNLVIYIMEKPSDQKQSETYVLENTPDAERKRIRKTPESDLVKQFIETAYTQERKLDSNFTEEISSFSYLKVEDKGDDIVFKYSFSQADFLSEEFHETIREMRFSLEERYQYENRVDWYDFQCFTGLIALDLSQIFFEQYGNIFFLPLDLKYYWGGKHQRLSDINASTQVSTLRIAMESEEDITAISEYVNLHTLEISGISEKALEDLFETETFKNLKSLRIDYDIELITGLSNLTQLEELYLGNCKNLSGAEYEELFALHNLKKLSLRSASNLEEIQFLDAFANLREIEITGSSIENLHVLKNNKSLTKLSLVDNYKLTDASAILSISNLQDLEIKNLKWNVENLSLNLLKNLKSVTIDYALLPLIEQNTGLQKLQIDLDINDFEYYNCSNLSGFSELEFLQFKDGYIENAADLSALPNLKTLMMEGVEVVEAENNHMLFNSSTITSLELTEIVVAFDETKIQLNDTLTHFRVENGTHWKLTGANNIPAEADMLELTSNMGDLALFIQNFPALESLALIRCEIRDITPLNVLVFLNKIDLEENEVKDFTPIQDLPNLKWRNYRNNPAVNHDLLSNKKY